MKPRQQNPSHPGLSDPGRSHFSPSRHKPAMLQSRRTVLERLVDEVPVEASTPPPTHPVVDPFLGRSFRLNLLNAAEDIPRVVRAYVKLKGMECAMVLRPHDGQGVMVHVEGGQAWKWTGLDSDVPQRPHEALAVNAAAPLLKALQKSLPPQGPVTLRGQWSGKLSCDNGNPRLSLERKVASYGKLYLWSDAVKQVWHWRVERVEKWFSQPGNQEGSADTLAQAIRDGLANAMGLLGEACSVRDSRRRAALDTTYAENHPNRPAKEGADPTEKFNPKEPKGGKASQATAGEGSSDKKAGKNSSPGSASTGKASSGKAPTAAPGSEPTSSAPAEKAARRKNATSASPRPSSPAPAAPKDADEIDAAKDKLLMDAFGDAISKALANAG